MNRPTLRSVLVPAVALVAVAGLASCSSDSGSDTGSPTTASGDAGAAAADGSTVTVHTFDFQPDPLTVDAGTTITFVNDDAIDHTVTAGTREAPTPDVFDGRLPEQDATFELTLDEPGTYDYFCMIHPGPGMTGVIEVE